MTATVSMSSLWLRCITSFCLIFTALGATENSGVIWKNVEEHVTIQCKCPKSGHDSLTLKKGLNEEFEVLVRVNDKDTINKQFSDRLQVNGAMPNVSILIKNLTSNDTGPYWCVYKMFDAGSTKTEITKGLGSVLLVVTDSNKPMCEEADKNLIVGSVVITAAVLLCIILSLFVWLIHKSKSKKPRRVPTNDVYEDMRGTLRR